DQLLARVPPLRSKRRRVAAQIPQLGPLVPGAERARERVLLRVVEDDHPRLARKAKASGLANWDRGAEELRRAPRRRLQCDYSRDVEQVARVRLELEILEPARKQKNGERLVHLRP